MQQRLTRLLAIATITLILAGCGGGGMATLLGLVSIGEAVGDIQNLFDDGGDDTEQTADVLLDGQFITEVEDSTVELSGLPEGEHRLQIVSSDHRGVITTITVDRDSPFPLDGLVAQDGGYASGTVMLQDGTNPPSPAANIPVYAISGGIDTVQNSAPITIPPGRDYYVVYTNDAGEFEFRALWGSRYLITSAIAGFRADVELVDDLDATNIDLTLVRDGTQQTGRAAGNITGQTETNAAATVALNTASVRASLGTAFAPQLRQQSVTEIEDQYENLPDEPWFQWTVLATLSDSSGYFELPLPPGSPRLDCFAYGYQPKFVEPEIAAGDVVPVDFALEQ